MTKPPTSSDSNSDTGLGHGRRSPPGAPRWAKVFGIIFIVLVALLVILHLTGHSPGGHTSHPSLAEHGVQRP
jgi:hypothetical protein